MKIRFGMLVAALCLCTGLSAQSYNDRAAQTDMNDANAVFELAMWCEDNGMSFRKNKLLRKVVALDPNHHHANEAMGNVLYNGKWVHRSRVPGASKKGGKSKSGKKQTIGPAPTAEQVEWDLTPLKIKDEGIHQYLMTVVAEMNGIANYEGGMEVAWRTMMMDEYKPHAAAAFAQSLLEPNFKDLFGVSSMLTELFDKKDADAYKIGSALLPFMVKASERISDQEDIYFFTSMVGKIGDKRVVPRLAQILEAGGDPASGAKIGLSMITLIPEDEVTASKVEDWWKRNHAIDNSAIYGSMIESGAPEDRISACYRLYETQDSRIMPALIELLGSNDRGIHMRSIGLLQQITGNDWGLGDFNLPAGKKKENLKRLEQWWEEEGNRFVFIEFRGKETDDGQIEQVTVDPVQQWISALSHTDRNKVREATDGLRRKGMDAVPPMIDALEGGDPILRSKVRDLLRDITRQNFGYEPFGDDADRSEAVAAWRAWHAEQAPAGAE